MTKKKASLETSLKEIAKIIQEMERNDLGLEQSLASFEKGIQLIKDSQMLLQQAEQKISILMNETELRDFQTRDANNDDSH